MDTLAERLISAREAADLTQTQLGKKVGAGQSLISNLENGENRSSTKLPEIAHALNVSAYWLKTGKGERSPSGLSPEEQRILAGFRLMGEELRASWLGTADTKIAEAAAQSRVIDMASWRQRIMQSA